MKFEEMKKKGPNVKSFQKKYEALKEELKNAKSSSEAYKVVKKYFKLEDGIQSDQTVVSVRHTINALDEEYSKLNEKWDEAMPVVQSFSVEFIKELLSSKYRKELEEKLSPYFFKQAENQLKCFDDKIIPLLIEESKLVNQYDLIFAKGKVTYKGEELSLTQLGKYFTSSDRQERIDSYRLYYGYIEEHDEEIGEIYDKLVHLRDKMAHELGFSSFIDLAYLRLGRSDYNSKDVAIYREQIHKVVVPKVKKLRKRQEKRLGMKNADFLDYSLAFTSGNPKPKGDSSYLVGVAQDMYHKMSKESGEFFDFMVSNNLMDLDAKPGKMGGGYMTYIPRYKSPFIFSNSNGTSQDVDTLTHEVGHAFQGYLGSKIAVPSFRMPTLEAAEIDSMSMEFFAYPYMEGFFKEDKDKYLFSHLDDAISFLPYGVEVDEFQHWVFENVDATHEERCKKWVELDKKYRPYLKFNTVPYLKKGKMWMRQSHIFGAPFYYIDYTLAQVLAFQFKVEMDKNYDRAWKKYVKLLKMGGKYPFVELITKAHLRNPFVDGNVKKVVNPLVKKLDQVDDTKF